MKVFIILVLSVILYSCSSSDQSEASKPTAAKPVIEKAGKGR